MIAQMLTAAGKKLYFYTRYNEGRHRNDIEIDFLLSNESRTKMKMFPIEVKSSKNYTTSSYCESFFGCGARQKKWDIQPHFSCRSSKNEL